MSIQISVFLWIVFTDFRRHKELLFEMENTVSSADVFGFPEFPCYLKQQKRI